MFHKQNSYTTPPRVTDIKCAWDVIDNTHTNRMKKIEGLRIEVQELLDVVSNIKRAEEKYLRGLGLVMESPINDDGTPTRNLYTTLPDMGTNSRNEAASTLVDTKFEDYSNPNNRPREHPSQQDVSSAYAEALTTLRNEDSTARRYEHRILNANLMANIKRMELKKLLDEQANVEGDNNG